MPRMLNLLVLAAVLGALVVTGGRKTGSALSPDPTPTASGLSPDQLRDSLRSLPADPAVTYHALPPEGAPPTTGWPVLVAFTSSSGQQIYQRFADITDDTGVLLVIIPDTISADKQEQIVLNITAILADVCATYPVDPRGAVLYGFSAAASLTTLYARDVPENVAGIVAENAPVIFMPAGEKLEIVYAFVYGEEDGGINPFNLEKIKALRAQGYTVWYDVVPGAGHVFTRQGIERVFDLIRTVFLEPQQLMEKTNRFRMIV